MKNTIKTEENLLAQFNGYSVKAACGKMESGL